MPMIAESVAYLQGHCSKNSRQSKHTIIKKHSHKVNNHLGKAGFEQAIINIKTSDILSEKCLMCHDNGYSNFISGSGLNEGLIYSLPSLIYFSTNGNETFLLEFTIVSELDIKLPKDITNKSTVESAMLFTLPTCRRVSWWWWWWRSSASFSIPVYSF